MWNEGNRPARELTRLLFTGTGERMIDNVVALLPNGCDIIRCVPSETDFILSLNKNKPHAVIVCLESETRDMLRVYDILCMDENYADTPVIGVGYEDDCKRFRSRLPIRNLMTFTRPLNREAFLDTLREYVAISEQRLQPLPVPSAPQVQSGQEMELAEVGVEESEKELLASEKTVIAKIEKMTRRFGRKSILVVDDDVRMLNVIKSYLQDLYNVTVVPSGKLALRYIAKKPTDLVLLDYMMPEMDGPEVLRQIRMGSVYSNVPVLFLTGVSDKDSVMRGLELRPDGYLLKPVSRIALLEKVTEIVLGL